MKPVTDTRPGLYEARFPAATIAPLSVAMLPVPVQPAQTSLEIALANINKLDEALAAAGAAAFAARSNPLTRWAATHITTTRVLGAAVPALVTYGVFATSGASGTGFAPLMSGLIGTIGFCFGSLWSYDVVERQAGKGAPLTTSDVASAATMLREMSATERAFLKAHATRSLENKVSAARLTSAAAESLRDALDEGTDTFDAAKRTGRVALMVDNAMRGDFNSWSQWTRWFDELKGLLREHPCEERRGAATMLLAYCYKDERCTLPLGADQADALYNELRAAQKAAD